VRKAFVPDFWVMSDIGDAALRTLIVLSLHKDKLDHCYMTNDKIAGIMNKDVRRVQADLNRAIEMKFIERKFDAKGKRFFVLNMNGLTGDAQRHPMTENDMTENVMGCRSASGGDDAQRHGGVTLSVTPLENPHIGTTYFSNISLQPRVYEGDLTELPIGQPKRIQISIEVRTELAGWLMGDEIKFVAAIDWDWSEEFILWCIGQAKRAGIRKAAYLLAICKNNWRENWCSPVDAEKAADEASREKVRERMRNLK